ncbi:uncharacterized protein Z519_04640 [Cladophialophora bantiana CBS 173.52]|uniref:Uncharacterized protein n=1 Tax=Cladophialophora bantiana (strain ATCC 10958 / CBS 173.52 / CDC B-1940 / NIH 8579) TaxID=1442370 RepID=A0A0D2HMR4_CLAB1|nr:uncharacterized protein Z519_04640 [Cladophialophora bantiana CBS 173.52]KIW94663.1 hypothetical protein Z519_04640 [Cladophialophora bantiana CBS 173.52]
MKSVDLGSQSLLTKAAQDLQNPIQDHSDFKGFEFQGSQATDFAKLLDGWIRGAESNGALTFGYSLTTGKAAEMNPQAPTFLPAREKLQVYPYKSPFSHNISIGLSEDGEKNMLIILNTGSLQGVPEKEVLPYSGNWCIKNIPATLAVSKDVFFNSFLVRPWPTSLGSQVPLLVRINQAAYFEAKMAHAEKHPFNSEFSFRYGKADLAPGIYDFREVSDTQTGDVSWAWSRNSSKSHQDGGSAFHARAEISTASSTTVTAQPAGNKVKIDGTTTLTFKTSIVDFGISQNGSAKIIVKYSFELSLRSILEGGLFMDMPLSCNNVSLDVKIDKTFLQPRSSIENLANDVVSKFRGDTDLQTTADALKDVLQTTGGFVVPGGGTFFYKDPIFNKNRDLLISAEYDG